MRYVSVLIAVIVMCLASMSWAGSLTVPNTFQGGQKALASEVNENFDEVEAEVTDNANNISSNATSITNNAAGISSNADSITNIDGDLDDKLDALACSNGQVLKYNAGTSSYECADDLDTINSNADTLDNLDSSDFAESTHHHVLTTSICLWRADGDISAQYGGFMNADLPNDSGIAFDILPPSDLDSTSTASVDVLFRKASTDTASGDVVLYAAVKGMSSGTLPIPGEPTDTEKANYTTLINIPSGSVEPYRYAATISFPASELSNKEILRVWLGRDGVLGDTHNENIYLLEIRLTYPLIVR